MAEHRAEEVGTRLVRVKVRGWEQATVLTLKMKKSSMNMAPRGRIPAVEYCREAEG